MNWLIDSVTSFSFKKYYNGILSSVLNPIFAFMNETVPVDVIQNPHNPPYPTTL